MKRVLPIALIQLVILSCFNILPTAYYFSSTRNEGPADFQSLRYSADDRLGDKQQDCGIRCIYFVSELFGKSSSLSALRKKCPGTDKGVSLRQLSDVATDLGFQAAPMRLDCENLLRHLSKPNSCAILHCRYGHFILAFAGESKRVRIVDFSTGIEDVTEADLLSDRLQWEGNSLLLTAE